MDQADKKTIVSKLDDADAILVTAANGFSISEGFNLFANNDKFHQQFGDYESKYGIQNIFQGMTTLYSDAVDEWKFYSRVINYYISNYAGSKLMDGLKQILSGKDYFVVTSNTEHHFELAGLDTDNIFEIEGNLTQMHCNREKNSEMVSTIALAKKFEKDDEAGVSNYDLVPKCKNDGEAMRLNVSSEPSFLVDKVAQNRFSEFLKNFANKKIVVLEMGIGPRNQMIKSPIMNLVMQMPESTYISINKGELNIPEEIADKSIGIDGDLTETITEIATGMRTK